MIFQPLTKSDLHDWDKPANAPYGFFHEYDVRSAVSYLKDKYKHLCSKPIDGSCVFCKVNKDIEEAFQI